MPESSSCSSSSDDDCDLNTRYKNIHHGFGYTSYKPFTWSCNCNEQISEAEFLYNVRQRGGWTYVGKMKFKLFSFFEKKANFFPKINLISHFFELNFGLNFKAFLEKLRNQTSFCLNIIFYCFIFELKNK